MISIKLPDKKYLLQASRIVRSRGMYNTCAKFLTADQKLPAKSLLFKSISRASISTQGQKPLPQIRQAGITPF